MNRLPLRYLRCLSLAILTCCGGLHAAENQAEPNAWAKVIQRLKQGRRTLATADDCTYVLLKRERTSGGLSDLEHYAMKVRHRPFSVYVQGLRPSSVAGQEAAFIQGKNGGKMTVNPGGIKGRLTGILTLSPTSPMVMKHSRHPITEAGPLNLLDRMLTLAQQHRDDSNCTITLHPGETVHGQACTRIDIQHAARRRGTEFSHLRLYLDDDSDLPVKMQAWGWADGSSAPLLEDYSYTRLQLNRGLRDRDFTLSRSRFSLFGR